MHQTLKVLTRGISFALALLATHPGVRSQAQSPAPETARKYDAAFFNALKWRSIGPVRGGRSIACAGSASRR